MPWRTRTRRCGCLSADPPLRSSPPGTPPLWVTSLTRSVGHQRHLRSLGYAALLPSAHCVGYAADVEMSWFRRFGADQAAKLSHARQKPLPAQRREVRRQS